MAGLRDIRKRIASVKNTRQITKAMKLVSGAKLKRASDAAIASRPYNAGLRDMFANLAQRSEIEDHRLLRTRDPIKRVRILVFSSDRGLCGSFNGNVTRRLDALIQETSQHDVSVVAIGRKAAEYGKRRGYEMAEEHTGLKPPDFQTLASRLAASTIEDFLEGRIDEVHMVYNQFKSALTQVLVVKQLLPFIVPAHVPEDGESQTLVDYIFDPSKESILDALLPQMITNLVLQALLESTASEHGARMTAMDSATRNASDMIEKLTLKYNRARQAAITRELVEIVSGAEALK